MTPRRSAAAAVLAAAAFTSWTTASVAEDAPVAQSGTIEEFDAVLGFDRAAPIFDVDEAAEERRGATVTQEACTIGDVPTLSHPLLQRFMRRPIETQGQFVVTPSGNAHLVCHVDASGLLRGTPPHAIVIDDAVCMLPNRRRTRDSHLVLTPSGHITLTCHFQPNG